MSLTPLILVVLFLIAISYSASTKVEKLSDFLDSAYESFSDSVTPIPEDKVETPDKNEIHFNPPKVHKKKTRRSNSKKADMKEVHKAIKDLNKVIDEAKEELGVNSEEIGMFMEHPEKIKEVGNSFVYSLYERKKQEVEKKDKVIYRIKSSDDKQPSACSESGKPSSRVVCPTSKGQRWWICLRNDDLCDGTPDCPNGEDENPVFCMFHKAKLIYNN